MAEQIYTIPVNDAFDSGCECPMCQMQKDLERNAIEYTMGPSYMEDDNRAMTDKLGFCSHHLRMLYQEKNRLGLALMMNTHMNKTIQDMRALAAKGPAAKAGLFGKNTPNAPVVDYIENMEKSCFICGRMDDMFVRYVDTIFHMEKRFRVQGQICYEQRLLYIPLRNTVQDRPEQTEQGTVCAVHRNPQQGIL